MFVVDKFLNVFEINIYKEKFWVFVNACFDIQ